MRVADLGPGWQSHVLACRFGAHVVERDDCIVVRTPDNPTYYWGNCLILPRAPRDDELAYWQRRFHEEIARLQPASRHRAFGVDAALLPGPLPSWRAAGIDEFDETAVLALLPSQLVAAPSPRAAGVALRELDLPRELDLAVEAQVATRDPSFDEAGYRDFRRAAMQRMAAIQADGSGAWFGAFVGDALAADCGLVHDAVLGRFQHVGTQPAWRRRGLCRALVHHVCCHAFEALGLQRLAMCADPHDVAIEIYRSLGFAPVETIWCLQARAPQ